MVSNVWDFEHGLGDPTDSVLFDSLAASARRAGLPLEGHTVVPLTRALQTHKSIEHLSGYIQYTGYWPALTDSMVEQLPPDSLAARAGVGQPSIL